MRLVEAYSDEHRQDVGLPRNCMVEDPDGLLVMICDEAMPDRCRNKLGDVQMVSVWETDHARWRHVLRERPNDPIYCNVLQSVLEVHMTLEDDDIQRQADARKQGFVSIHTHSEYSALDGLSKIEEIIDNSDLGVFITDHGVCAGHPEVQKLAAEKGIFGGCGIEANWVPDRFVRVDQYDYFHLILLAQNETGLRNLWAASTEANKTGFYGRPRMDWDILQRHSEGLICSTACLRGPVSDLLLQGRVDQAKALLARLMDIFRDRTYLEIHTTHAPGQEQLNKMLVELGQEMSLPLIAAVDSHYPCADDFELHQLWLRAQISSKKGQAKVEGGDDSRLFQGHQEYHLMGREEVRRNLAYLPASAVEEAIDNTVVLMESTEPYNITKSVTPMYAPDKGRKYALKRLLDICMANWDRKIRKRRHTKPESAYIERFEYEMEILKKKDFCDYFMIVQDYVRWVKDRRILVGPGRGSGAASLVAYLADITEVDPLEYDLPFARFITIDRPDPPDFDLDFPSSKRTYIQDGITERWGFDYVMRVGTHGRLRNKGAINDMARVLRDSMEIDYGDIEVIKAIFDAEESDSAGLGKPWEVVMNAAEDALAPYVAKYPALFDAAGRVSGRLKSYGKHAAGLVISTGEPLAGKLPMRRGADQDADDESEQMVAEFDYRALESMGLLKFDILTLRTLDTLQLCLDLIRERKGLVIDPYEWQEEFDDPQVWEAISDGNTLGIFTFETPAMTEMVKRVRPKSIMDLAVINALGRPGPQRSGATELYLRRRAGQEPVVYDHPLLEQVVASTYGLIVFQEQVMRTTQVLAGFSDTEAEAVRKILGKKLKDKAAAKGEEFVKGCLENGIEEAVARRLWDQMATFSLYGFSICHSVPYAMLGYYCGWFRVHYPEEFFTAVLSTVDKDDVPKFVNECRKLGFAVLPPDINESRRDFAAHPMAVRYGLLGIKGVGEKAVDAILAHQPYASFQEFREKMAKTQCNMGVIKTLAAAGAFDSIYPNRKQLETFLELEAEGEDTRCVHKDPASVNSTDFICHYDWASEPVEFTAKGKAKQRKPPPKRCTTACRHYEPKGLPLDEMEPYTPAEVREKEMEHLGVWLTSTPFDRIPATAWIDNGDGLRLYKGSEVLAGYTGTYMIAGIPQHIKPHKDKLGNQMAFIDILAKDDVISVAVFASSWECHCPEVCLRHQVRVGKLGLYEIHKKDRKYRINGFTPISD